MLTPSDEQLYLERASHLVGSIAPRPARDRWYGELHPHAVCALAACPARGYFAAISTPSLEAAVAYVVRRLRGAQ